MYKDNYWIKPTGNYLPLQPGFELNRDYYIQLKRLRDPSNRSILIFYQLKKSRNSAETTFVVPDGCIDIIFCCNPKKPAANCYGTVLKSKQIVFQADYEYFGVRYLPEHGIYLMKELIDKEIPLQDIISADSFIVEKVVNAKTFQERIEFFNEFLKKAVPEFAYIPPLVKYSVEKIYLSKGNLNIDRLAQETGYSIRYLRKNFEDFIGISPKLFSEIVRFQNSLNMIITKEECNLWDVVSENGYYDQAHFINQFKKFCTYTPTKFKETFVKRTCVS